MGRDARHACTSTVASLTLGKVKKCGHGTRTWSWSMCGQTYARAEVDYRGQSVRFRYTAGAYGEPNSVDCTVYLTATPAHFGGERQWYRCPRCAGRCGVIYMGYSGPRCRKCLRLSYPSQRVDAVQRVFSQQARIRRRLGGDGQTDDFPDRLKGMHWKTYQRFADQYEAAERRHDRLITNQLANWLGVA